METKKQKVDALYTLIAGTQDVQQIAALFEDLCTVKELENMAERLYAAKLLLQGHTYAQILTEADISSATLSRVSRCVQYGKGYSQLLSNAFPADDPETPS